MVFAPSQLVGRRNLRETEVHAPFQSQRALTALAHRYRRNPHGPRGTRLTTTPHNKWDAAALQIKNSPTLAV